MWIWSEKDGLGYPGGRLRTWISLVSLQNTACLAHMGVSKHRETPQNGWDIMENPIKMGDLLFSETYMILWPPI